MDPFWHWERGFGHTLNFKHGKLKDVLQETFHRTQTIDGTIYLPTQGSLILCEKTETMQEYRRRELLLDNVTPTNPLYEARTLQWSTQLVICDPDESRIAISEGVFYYVVREAIRDKICSRLTWTGGSAAPWESATRVADIGQFSLGSEANTLTVQLRACRSLTTLPETSKTGREGTTCCPKLSGYRVRH